MLGISANRCRARQWETLSERLPGGPWAWLIRHGITAMKKEPSCRAMSPLPWRGKVLPPSSCNPTATATCSCIIRASQEMVPFVTQWWFIFRAELFHTLSRAQWENSLSFMFECETYNEVFRNSYSGLFFLTSARWTSRKQTFFNVLKNSPTLDLFGCIVNPCPKNKHTPWDTVV